MVKNTNQQHIDYVTIGSSTFKQGSWDKGDFAQKSTNYLNFIAKLYTAPEIEI